MWELQYGEDGEPSEQGPCQHDRRQGDNNGVSCMDCGKQLEGYGFGGNGNGKCIHRYQPMYGSPPGVPDLEVCIYCEDEQNIEGLLSE
jgi:hypothetical protein